MSGRLKQYDPKLVIITWGSEDISSGIAADEFITIARLERGSTMNVGGDGGATRVVNNNRTSTVTVTYRKGASTLDFLADKVSNEEAKQKAIEFRLQKDKELNLYQQQHI